MVKGHKRKVDNYEEEDLIQEEIPAHAKLDSDDESREINIARIGVWRNKEAPCLSDSEYSQHEYEYVVGPSQDKVRVVR